jgi:hypothetical protein
LALSCPPNDIFQLPTNTLCSTLELSYRLLQIVVSAFQDAGQASAEAGNGKKPAHLQAVASHDAEKYHPASSGVEISKSKFSRPSDRQRFWHSQ